MVGKVIPTDKGLEESSLAAHELGGILSTVCAAGIDGDETAGRSCQDIW